MWLGWRGDDGTRKGEDGKASSARAGPTHARSVAAGHRCQLSQALSHILVLCLLFLDKEDIQPVNSHKTRLEAGRRQSAAATSVGSRPCSLASTSEARPHPFPRPPPARPPPPWPRDGTWPPHATPRHLVPPSCWAHGVLPPARGAGLLRPGLCPCPPRLFGPVWGRGCGFVPAATSLPCRSSTQGVRKQQRVCGTQDSCLFLF